MKRRPIPSGLRFAVLSEAGFRCTYCGLAAPEATLHVDHIVPVAAGGRNDRTNLVAACSACNLGKRARGVAGPTTTANTVVRLESKRRNPNAIEAATVALQSALRDLVAAVTDEAVGPERLLSIDEAAERLGVGRSIFFSLMRQGHIRTFQIGRRRVVPDSAIAEYIKRRAQAVPA